MFTRLPRLQTWLFLGALLASASVALWLGYVLRRPAAASQPAQTPLRVTVINVGQGGATLIRTPGGGTVLIGAGPTEAGSDVVQALQNAGVKHIDLLILPYPYAEAIGGVPELFEEFQVKTILEPGGERVNAHITDAARLAHQFQTDWQTVRAGKTFIFPGDHVVVEILAPEQITPGWRATDNSLVIAVRYGKTRFLFAGGTGSRGERALLSRAPDLRADWLLVARSGSDEASSSEFLRSVNPSFAVISVGPNRDGLPGSATLTRLQATGARVFRTDEKGGQSLSFTSDGNEVMYGDAGKDK